MSSVVTSINSMCPTGHIPLLYSNNKNYFIYFNEVIFLDNMIKKNEKASSDIKYITLGALTVLLLGFFTALLTGDSSLYGNLKMPPLSPPPILFSIVWSILYVLIGGTIGGVYSYNDESVSEEKKNGLLLAVISLVFNLLWFPLFFGKGQLLAALVDLIAIILFTVLYAKYFYKIKPIFAYLTIPYILWLLFAFYLNLGVVILN